MDFRAQRYRDRLRAQGRFLAFRTARRTRNLLDDYLSARQGTYVPAPITEVRWGRVLAVASGLATLVYVLVQRPR